MNLTDFTEQFKAEFIDADEIILTETTKFRDIGSWDSLTGMSITIMIEEQYDVAISEADFKSCTTTTEMYQLIVEKKSEK